MQVGDRKQGINKFWPYKRIVSFLLTHPPILSCGETKELEVMVVGYTSVNRMGNLPMF